MPSTLRRLSTTTIVVAADVPFKIIVPWYPYSNTVLSLPIPPLKKRWKEIVEWAAIRNDVFPFQPSVVINAVILGVTRVTMVVVEVVVPTFVVPFRIRRGTLLPTAFKELLIITTTTASSSIVKIVDSVPTAITNTVL
jgi:hypothetical protein